MIARIINDEQTQKLTFLTIIGREVLSDVLARPADSQFDFEQSLRQFIARAEENIQSKDIFKSDAAADMDVDAFFTFLLAKARRLAEENAAFADTMAEAEAVAGAAMTMTGDPESWSSIIRAVGLSSAILLGVAKLYGHAEPGDWQLGLEPGVPSGTVEIFEAISDAFREVNSSNQDPSGDDDGSGPTQTDSEPNSPTGTEAEGHAESGAEPHDQGHGEGASRSLESDTVAGRSLVVRGEDALAQVRQLTRSAIRLSSDGIPYADIPDAVKHQEFVPGYAVAHQLSQAIMTAFTPDALVALASKLGFSEQSDLQKRSLFNDAEVALQRASWASDLPFDIWCGVRTEATGYSGRAFRVSVRVVSHKPFSQGFVKKLEQYFDESFGRFVSMRWMSPPQFLASNRSGQHLPWSFPIDAARPLSIGAPVNIAGGAVGSLTLVLNKGNEYFALISGHTVFDDDGRADPYSAAANGNTAVFCPPEGMGPNPANSAGHVIELRTFDPASLARQRLTDGMTSNHISQDYALVKLQAHAVPPPAARTTPAGGAAFAKDFHRGKRELFDLQSVIKVPSKSGSLAMTVQATDVSARIWNPLTNSLVQGSDLIELTVDSGGGEVLAGDSGALLLASEPGVLRPLAAIVAASRYSKLGSVTEKTYSRQVVYAIPLENLALPGGMEID